MSRTVDYMIGARFLYKLKDSGPSDDFSKAGSALFEILEVMSPIQEIDPADIEALGRVIAEASNWRVRPIP